LRLGATLAVEAAARRDDVDAVVLWDPVVDGTRYLADLRLLQRRWLSDRPGSHLFAFSRQVSEVIGFPVTEAVRSELKQMALGAMSCPSLRRIVVLDSEDHDNQRQWVIEHADEWPEVIRHAGSDVGDWHRPEAVHSALLAPKTMLRVATLVEDYIA
jgi:hypothetical protein